MFFSTVWWLHYNEYSFKLIQIYNSDKKQLMRLYIITVSESIETFTSLRLICWINYLIKVSLKIDSYTRIYN